MNCLPFNFFLKTFSRFPIAEKMRPKKKRVMFVDDEPNILASLWRVFRKDGFEIYLAHNGWDALNKLRKNPVDLVVSDYRMPGMSGLELLEEVRKQYPQTKGMILSAYDDYPRLLREAKKCPKLFPFISKPWEERILKSMVNRLLEQGCNYDSFQEAIAKAS